jgi:hypothetical protein
VRGRLLDLPCPAKVLQNTGPHGKGLNLLSELFDDSVLQSENPQDLVVTDEGPFVLIPKALIDQLGPQLGAYGLAVYVGLKAHANRQQGMTTFILTETLAKELSIGESTVRRELTRMVDFGLITKQKRFARSSIYCILPVRYHVADSPLPYSALSATIERHNNKNLTRRTEQSRFLPSEPPNPIFVEDVYRYYLASMGKNPKTYELTTSRRKKLDSRFRECIEKTKDAAKAAELMKVSVDNCAASAFHMGNNPSGKKYNDLIDNIFKSYEQMEKWWND